jgi:PAS domain S-box-containing protein
VDPSSGFAIYEKILIHMADGVISLDLEGRVVTFNPAAGRLLAVADEEAIGRPYAEIFFGDSRFDQLNDLVLKAISEAEVVHSEAIQVDTPEHLRHLNVSTSFLRDGSGVPIGVIVVLSDVTTEHRRRQLQRLFGEYLDPRIIDRLSRTADHLGSGVRQVATISLLDLEGFMRLGDRMKPGQLVRFLNVFLSLMSEPIGKRGGVLFFNWPRSGWSVVRCRGHGSSGLEAPAGGSRGRIDLSGGVGAPTNSAISAARFPGRDGSVDA